MLSFLYDQHYEPPPCQESVQYSHFEQDAQVYALADKYRIPTLKRYVLDRVSAVFKDDEFDVQAFLMSVRTVWTSTPSSDQGLRNLYVKQLLCHRETYFPEAIFEELIRDFEGLATDVLLADRRFTYLGQSWPKPVQPESKIEDPACPNQ